jgi:hypothetical protein
MLNGSGLIHGIIEGLFVKCPMDETGALQRKYTFSKYRNLTYNCVGGGGRLGASQQLKHMDRRIKLHQRITSICLR